MRRMFLTAAVAAHLGCNGGRVEGPGRPTPRGEPPAGAVEAGAPPIVVPVDDLPPDVRTVAAAMVPVPATLVRAERMAFSGVAVAGADDIAAELARVADGSTWDRRKLREAAAAVERAEREGKRAPSPRIPKPAPAAAVDRTVAAVYYVEAESESPKRTFRMVLATDAAGWVRAFTHCDRAEWRDDMEAIAVAPRGDRK